MPITVGDFLDVLERLAPSDLAEEWDACGLQVGSVGAPVNGILVTLNITDAVLEEASARSCQLIITHHPLIFKPLTAVSDDSEAGRLALNAARAGIAVVAAHTNLDAAPGGLAEILAQMLGLERLEPLAARSGGTMHKLVVFVPEKDLAPVRQALFDAGAGLIGDYRHCSWYSAGTGTFQPMEGAKPAIGEVGNDETVTEYRLETLVAAEDLEAAVAAIKAAHSYEEPAYDIYPLVTIARGTPAGRVGELPEAVSAGELARRTAELFGAGELRYSDPGAMVRRVAVVPGSGAGFIGALTGKADILVTGDIKYHDSLQADAGGLGLIELPHDTSEALALERWLPRLADELTHAGVTVSMSSIGTSPWKKAVTHVPAAATVEVKAMEGTYRLHVDGGARGNPGPAAIGAALIDSEGNVVDRRAESIGEATNNIAEYRALIAGVEMALENGAGKVEIFSDSELIVKQLEGSYRVRNAGLKPLYDQARKVLGKLESYRLNAVPREENTIADSLVNEALDSSSA